MSVDVTASASPTTVSAGSETQVSVEVENTGQSAVALRAVQFTPHPGRIIRGRLEDVRIPIPVGESVTVKFGYTPIAGNGVIDLTVVTDEGEAVDKHLEVTVV
jgi:uncharacterized membrane protein